MNWQADYEAGLKWEFEQWIFSMVGEKREA
jgi:hypothetical protein